MKCIGCMGTKVKVNAATMQDEECPLCGGTGVYDEVGGTVTPIPCPFEHLREYPGCYEDCPDTDACPHTHAKPRSGAAVGLMEAARGLNGNLAFSDEYFKSVYGEDWVECKFLVAAHNRDGAQAELKRLWVDVIDEIRGQIAALSGKLDDREADLIKAKDEERERVISTISDELWKSRAMFDYEGKPTNELTKCTASVLSITSPRLAEIEHELNSKEVAHGTADTS